MKKGKKALTLLLIFTLALSLFPQSAQAAKKKKVKLSKKTVTVKIGKTVKLKLKNNKKKVKWTVISGKKNVTLSKKKKTGVTIKGKKPGTAKVQAKIGKKKYVCKVKVKKAPSGKKATNNSDKKTTQGNAGSTGVSKCVSKYHTTANESAGQNDAPAGCDTGTNGKTGKVLSGALCGRSGIHCQFCLF